MNTYFSMGQNNDAPPPPPPPVVMTRRHQAGQITLTIDPVTHEVIKEEVIPATSELIPQRSLATKRPLSDFILPAVVGGVAFLTLFT